MTIEEQKAYILQTMATLPVEEWHQTEDPAGRRYYRQAIHDVTFHFYPPSENTQPVVVVIRNENDMDEIRQTFYAHDDPSARMKTLWEKLWSYEIENGKKKTERNINIIYKELVHLYVKPVKPKKIILEKIDSTGLVIDKMEMNIPFVDGT
ncbi:MAG: hypothetical protein WC341_16825, partial [Bacteroidales bacterium]